VWGGHEQRSRHGGKCARRWLPNDNKRGKCGGSQEEGTGSCWRMGCRGQAASRHARGLFRHLSPAVCCTCARCGVAKMRDLRLGGRSFGLPQSSPQTQITHSRSWPLPGTHCSALLDTHACRVIQHGASYQRLRSPPRFLSSALRGGRRPVQNHLHTHPASEP
jgi:hypothetical protein